MFSPLKNNSIEKNRYLVKAVKYKCLVKDIKINIINCYFLSSAENDANIATCLLQQEEKITFLKII